MRLIIDEMESMVKNIRVLPISTVFNSFTRMVRDIASEKGKDIDFEIEGKSEEKSCGQRVCNPKF